MIASVYHADLNEAQGAGELARTLAAMPPAQGPFGRAEWFTLLGAECLAERHPIYAVASEGESVVALPLVADAPRRFTSLANWYSFWWQPLGDPALLTKLAREVCADTLHLAPLREHDVKALAAAFRAAGWAAFVRKCDVNHYLAVGGRTFAEYWTSRPGRLRETVRRKGRKGLVELRIACAFDVADWAAYEAIYRLSWKPGEGSPDFLRRFAEAEGAAGRLRLGIATIAGKPVAAQFWTVEAGTAFIHKLAHDETAKQHSPGTLLSAALFEHVIDRDRLAEIDFGTGDDPYKRDWMEARRDRFSIDLFRLAAPTTWPVLARAAVRHMLGR